MEQRVVLRFLTIKGLKAKKIKMEITSVYGDEALQISAVKKWRKHFMLGRTELGDDRRSGRSANSDLTHVIAELIRARPFLPAKYYADISGPRRKYVSEFFARNLGSKSFTFDGFHTSSPRKKCNCLDTCRFSGTVVWVFVFLFCAAWIHKISILAVLRTSNQLLDALIEPLRSR
jgi:hypothetical protein